MGDLNNTEAAREHLLPVADPVYRFRSFPIHACDDDPAVRTRYRPFLLDDEISSSDWVMKLELATAAKMVETEILSQGKDRLRVLVLYGSLRSRSYSKLLAYEASRILFRLGCDVRVYDLSGLPVKDDQQHDHPKVQELRALSKWSDGHVWVSPEQHGNLTAVFKNQIDWIPLSTGSVNGGSQSFNVVNSLRILGRWIRMFTIPNQSSIPKAWTHFTDTDDPEFVKYTIIMRPYFDLFGDRFSEREEAKVAK
ncbi:flavoprotein-like protein [Corynascus novoguineensis]|uniref:Flavoprotein-like protein n=1 Tax=Corynascus novoguineensis TaxID=1126955 RepID=A0AAN7CLQ5_9PEZI|nr:flavoprotein-like protein [Corynascus novoguineensis]